MRTRAGYSAYTQNNVSVESSDKLILMLYEGALQFASQAKTSMENNNIEKRVYWINRVMAIYFELINSLDFSAGDVAHYLKGLYQREIQLLTEANMTNNTALVDEVINVTKELIEAWKDNMAEQRHEKVG